MLLFCVSYYFVLGVLVVLVQLYGRDGNLSEFLVTPLGSNQKLIIGFSKTDAGKSYKSEAATTACNNCSCFLQASPSNLRPIVPIIWHNQKFLCFFAGKRESPALQIARGQKIEQRLSTPTNAHVQIRNTKGKAHVYACVRNRNTYVVLRINPT